MNDDPSWWASSIMRVYARTEDVREPDRDPHSPSECSIDVYDEAWICNYDWCSYEQYVDIPHTRLELLQRTSWGRAYRLVLEEGFDLRWRQLTKEEHHLLVIERKLFDGAGR